MPVFLILSLRLTRSNVLSLRELTYIEASRALCSLSPGVALTTNKDSQGKPSLMPSHIADWAVGLLTRPAHLRGNGPVLI